MERFELKAISSGAVPEALAKAEHYRLLNQPEEAESICRDILRLEPRKQQALVVLVLALTVWVPEIVSWLVTPRFGIR